jgi:hypothetical protein
MRFWRRILKGFRKGFVKPSGQSSSGFPVACQSTALNENSLPVPALGDKPAYAVLAIRLILSDFSLKSPGFHTKRLSALAVGDGPSFGAIGAV